MSDLKQVLVVDNGERAQDCTLSAELANMGYASITTPFEAAEDVLALVPSPVAIVLRLPKDAMAEEQEKFLALARRFSRTLGKAGVPVIVLNGNDAHLPPALLQRATNDARLTPPSSRRCGRGF